MTREEIKAHLEARVNGKPYFYFADGIHYFMGAGYGSYSYSYICCDDANSCGSNSYETYKTADELLDENFTDYDWELLKDD